MGYLTCPPPIGEERIHMKLFGNYDRLMDEETGGEVTASGGTEVAAESTDPVVEAAASESEESSAVENLDANQVEAVEEAIEEGASTEEVKELIETFKFKADGKDKEVTLDWNNKEDIIRRLQMAEAAPGALKRAAEIEKAYKNDVGRLQNDPWKVLEELGLDPDQLAEARITKQIEQMQKTP